MADDLESAVQQKRKESSAGGKKKVKKAAAGKKKKVTKKKDSGAGEKYFIETIEGANNQILRDQTIKKPLICLKEKGPS